MSARAQSRQEGQEGIGRKRRGKGARATFRSAGMSLGAVRKGFRMSSKAARADTGARPGKSIKRPSILQRSGGSWGSADCQKTVGRPSTGGDTQAVSPRTTRSTMGARPDNERNDPS